MSKVNDKWLGCKLLLPENVLGFITSNYEDESHYVCAILNSSCAELILRSIAGGSKSFGSPKMVEDSINIPEFNRNNKTHIVIADLSKRAHQLANINDVAGLSKIEEEIDDAIATMYGLKIKELVEVKKTLRLLEGEEIDEEIAEDKPDDVRIDFLNAVVDPNTTGSIEIAIVNPRQETITVDLYFPNRKEEVKTNKEQDSIKVKIPPLEAGEHKIAYNIIANTRETKGEFTLHVKEKKRFRRKQELSSKLKELMGDGE